MSGCIDQKLGQLLHDFELGLLSEEDNRRFELHLYDCDHCLDQVREFMDVSKILAKDPDARTLIEKVAAETGQKNHTKKFSPFLRLLVAATLIAMVIIPVYHYGIRQESPGITQTLELLPARTGGSDIIYLERGGNVGISFYVNQSFHGNVDLLIAGIAGDTVFSEQDFADINDDGLGEIVLPISSFNEGHYMLIIEPVTDSIDLRDIQYMFRVK
jgi:hypothetical protein